VQVETLLDLVDALPDHVAVDDVAGCLLESGILEERKVFVRAFISGITVRPDGARLDLMVNQLPSLNAHTSVVAGARYVPVQMKLQPLNRYLAGLRRAA
jgi:hypothetical protein